MKIKGQSALLHITTSNILPHGAHTSAQKHRVFAPRAAPASLPTEVHRASETHWVAPCVRAGGSSWETQGWRYPIAHWSGTVLNHSDPRLPFTPIWSVFNCRPRLCRHLCDVNRSFIQFVKWQGLSVSYLLQTGGLIVIEN